jgi:CRP-like cAMP-binding protein
MEPNSLSNLMAAINEALTNDDHKRALRIILTNFGLIPDPAPLRERVAMVLAQKGRKKEAVEILQLVGRHYANAGYPARAISVACQMRRLQPDTTNLLDHIATLYCIRSPFVMEGTPLLPLPGPTDDLDLSGQEPGLEEVDLIELAQERALDERGIITQPAGLPSLPFLSLLPEETLRRGLDFFEYDVYANIQQIMAREKTSELIWCVSDDIILREGETKHLLPSGAMLGLGAFGQSGRAPDVDVISVPGSEIVRISPENMQKVETEYPDFPNRLATLRRHAMTERLLERHPIFVDLEDEDRVDVIGSFSGMRVNKGDKIIEQSTPSPGLFIVLDGRVDIVRDDDDWEITIATLGSGDVFGEIGLVADKPAVAGCLMNSPGHLLHLPRDEFDALARRFPSIAKYTSRLAEERLNDVESTLSANDLAEVD